MCNWTRKSWNVPGLYISRFLRLLVDISKLSRKRPSQACTWSRSLPLHQVCLYFPVVERLPLCPCLWAGRFPWLLNLVVSHDFSGLTGSFPGLPFREVWKLNFRNSKWHKSLHFQQKRWQFHCFHPDRRAPFSKCFLAFCRQDSRDKYWLLIALMKRPLDWEQGEAHFSSVLDTTNPGLSFFICNMENVAMWILRNHTAL